MYTKELIEKVFDYDSRMRWLHGEEYNNRQQGIFDELISHIRDRAIDRQDTENKIQAIITKIENVVEKITKLLTDVESSTRMKARSSEQEFVYNKEEYIKEYAQILAENHPGYSEEHHLKVAEDVCNDQLIRRYSKRSKEIIYTILVLSIIDLDGHVKDETRLGDDGIDKELEEITQGIRVLLNIEEWRPLFEFIDHIATKESSWWFTSQELGFAIRGRVERELLRIETETKIEEEKKKRVELEKQLEELKQRIKEQPEQKEELK